MIVTPCSHAYHGNDVLIQFLVHESLCVRWSWYHQYFWKWLSTKHINIILLTSWDHYPHRLSETGGSPTGCPITLWTKDYNGFSGASCGVEEFAWFGAASCNGTWSRPSNVTGKHIEETDFRIDYLFCPNYVGGGALIPVQLKNT